MQKELFLIISISWICAADDDDASRSSEDNYALRLVDETNPNRTKRYVEMDSDNSDTNEENFVHGSKLKKKKNHMIRNENEQYEIEKERGDMADLFGNNPHYYYPETYNDLGRRFVPQYPYKEPMDINNDEEAENTFDFIAKAPPELVLAIAAKAAFLDAMKPRNRLEENLINKEILRSGNYWNAVWKEDVNPDALRTQKENVDVEPIKLKVMPGTELYKLVSELTKISPRLIYAINKK